MTTIKNHQCPSCGGNLTVDLERQMYLCSFCGCSFDYEYFREEEALKMGEKYLSRGEFASAIDLYKFLLDKDPHGFQALRGLMIASGRLKEIDELYGKIGSENFSYDKDQVELVCNSAAADDKEYFDEMSKIYSDMKDVSDMVKEKEKIRQERKKFESKINLEHKKRDDLDFTTRSGVTRDPKSVFMTNAVTSGIFYLITAVFLLTALGTGEGIYCLGSMFLLPAVALTLVNIIIVYPRYKEVKGIDVRINAYSNESGTRRIKIHELDERIDDDSAKIRKACTALIKKDKSIMAEVK